MANMFRYDVAISFLDGDEPSARAISYALNPGLASFVYSERQAELVGNDGVDAFSDVFGRDARIVVVLYRDGWGQTKWTRIEETAIKNRVLNDGADFLTFVHLDKQRPTPRWLPQSRLWLDFGRLGVQGAIAIIEERVAQAGAAVREETVEENAARLGREDEEAVRKLAFLHSPGGVKAADAAADAIFARASTLQQSAGYTFTSLDYTAAMFRDGYTVHIRWNRYRNTLAESHLLIREWRGRPDFGPHRYANVFKAPQKLSERTFRFDLVDEEQTVWREEASGRLYTSERIADEAVRQLLDLVRKGRADTRRQT